MKQPFLSKKSNVFILALFYTLLWGCAFPLVKMCMSSFQIASDDNFSKMLIAGIRFFCSGVITLIFSVLAKEKTKIRKKTDVLLIFLYGLFGTSLQYACTYIGLSRMNGSIGALCDQLCVFFIIIVSGLFFADDRLTAVKIIGSILGFSGVALTTVGDLKFSFRLDGEGMMLLSAVFQTVAYFLAKQSVSHFSALKLVGYSHLIGGGFLIVLSYACGGRISVFSVSGMLILLALVGISSAAYVLSVMPLKYFAASEVSVFNLLIPVFGGLMSGLFLNENIFNIRYLLALVLVVMGIYLVNLSKRKE